MNNFNVINSKGNSYPFKPVKIKDRLMNELKVSEKEAKNITRNVVKQIKKEYVNDITTSDIRALVTAQLIKKGQVEEASKNAVHGLTEAEWNGLLNNGCDDNANISFSPEMIAKYAYDSIAKSIALSKIPKECAEAHKQGYIHIHDLEYYETRPNCMNYDLRFFAKNGLKIDGKGDMGSVAKPAKSLEVLLNHMLQAWMAGATVFSGGQGFVNFNTLLAPYCKNRSYKDIKQALQGFIFNCNMSLICRGGQVLFSSIALDLSIPDVLKDKPAISINGVPIGVYGDYQEEADLIFRAILEISNEKDGDGAYHRFPNFLFNIREGDLDEYTGNCKLLHELGANNPTLYYVNCSGIERTVMGCRTSLPANYTGDYEKDCMNTGNFMYNTLNLHLLALESNNEQDFYKLIDKYCEICYTSLIHRREQIIDVIYNKHMSDFLLQKDKDTGLPLWDINRTTVTIGYCGLYEAVNELRNKNIAIDGEDIISLINAKKDEFFERDGLRWSVIASPAESTVRRFASINKVKYPKCTVQGSKNSYYLTNSHHIPVSQETTIIDHIRNAKIFHPLSQGGAILHIWMGESWVNAEAIWSLNKKILNNNVIFWAYSTIFTFCRECQYTINDDIEICPICNSTDLRKYDRITGYYLPIDTFNSSKQKEVEDRFRHKIGDE